MDESDSGFLQRNSTQIVIYLMLIKVRDGFKSYISRCQLRYEHILNDFFQAVSKYVCFIIFIISYFSLFCPVLLQQSSWSTFTHVSTTALCPLYFWPTCHSWPSCVRAPNHSWPQIRAWSNFSQHKERSLSVLSNLNTLWTVRCSSCTVRRLPKPFFWFLRLTTTKTITTPKSPGIWILILQ